MMSQLPRLFCLLLTALLVCVAPRGALAEDSKKECAAAYEKSQELRAGGKLQKAREMLVVCAQEVCPAFVQSDCAQWLTEVQREIPTIVISAKDRQGEDTAAVKVTIDGQLVAKELDGKALPLDPGVHKLHFELEGQPPVDQQLVVRQSEKDRVVEVSFAPRDADVPADNPYAGAARVDVKDEGQSAESSGKPLPLRLYSYIAGGVGVAGIAGFAVFGAMGKSAKSDLEDRNCKPNCPQSEVDSIKTKYLLADISLGVGIAGLGAGTALFILSLPKGDGAAKEESSSVKFDVLTTKEATLATVSGRF